MLFQQRDLTAACLSACPAGRCPCCCDRQRAEREALCFGYCAFGSNKGCRAVCGAGRKSDCRRRFLQHIDSAACFAACYEAGLLSEKGGCSANRGQIGSSGAEEHPRAAFGGTEQYGSRHAGCRQTGRATAGQGRSRRSARESLDNRKDRAAGGSGKPQEPTGHESVPDRTDDYCSSRAICSGAPADYKKRWSTRPDE